MMRRDHTLQNIEQITGTTPLLHFAKASLLEWYDGIREQRICQLAEPDLNQLIKHNLYTEYLLPECLHRLYEDPVVGAHYDGQLLEMLATYIPSHFWMNHQSSRASIEEFLIMLNTFKIPEIYPWTVEAEKKDYLYSIEQLKAKIKCS